MGKTTFRRDGRLPKHPMTPTNLRIKSELIRSFMISLQPAFLILMFCHHSLPSMYSTSPCKLIVLSQVHHMLFLPLCLCLCYSLSLEGPFSLLWLGELLLILQDPAQIVFMKPFLTLTGKVICFLCSPLRSGANSYEDDTYDSSIIIYLCVHLLC